MDAKEIIRALAKGIYDATDISREEFLEILGEDESKNEDSVAAIQGFCKHDAHRVKFKSLRQYKAGVTTFRVCQDIWVINYGEECYVADRDLARECENAYRAFINK